MHRIDTGSAGPGNSFVNNTVIGPDWAQAVQEEIAETVEGAGLTLDKLSNTQLLEAIQFLRVPQRTAFTTPGGGTFTVPSGIGGTIIRSISVWVAGAGGGGGSGSHGGQTGTGADGDDGGNTTFTGPGTNITAEGGGGGDRGATATNGAFHAGGSGGDFFLTGEGGDGGNNGNAPTPNSGSELRAGENGANGGLVFKRINVVSGDVFTFNVGERGDGGANTESGSAGAPGAHGWVLIQF